MVGDGLLDTAAHGVVGVWHALAGQGPLGLGDSPTSRSGMQAVAACRGLAHLARMAGDFPTALATAGTLGREARHHRVEGDIWWSHGPSAAPPQRATKP